MNKSANPGSSEGHACPSACAGAEAVGDRHQHLLVSGRDYVTQDTEEPVPGRSSADDLRVCWHEASHAIIGRRLHAAALGGCTVQACADYSGLTWGPDYVRRAKFSDAQDDDVPSMCFQLAGIMPKPGESRADWVDVYLHCFHRIVELVSGTEGERLFLDGEPWFAADDERQAIAYASLVTSSPVSAAALISACRIESLDLLRDSAHIVAALAAELRTKRTMDGAAIDACIERAVAAKLLADERQRRRDWKCTTASAASFASLQVHRA